MIRVISVLVGQDEKLSEPLVFETKLGKKETLHLLFDIEYEFRENKPNWSVDDITKRFYEHDDIERVDFKSLGNYLV